MAQLQVQVPPVQQVPVPVSVPVPVPMPLAAVPALGNQNSLYVGDLGANVDETNLFDVFGPIGPILSIRVCRDITTKRSLGYAYVNFSNSQDAMKAMELLNFTPILGKPMRIMFSHRDPSIRKSGTGNIYVKHLDKSLNNKDFYDAFAPYGTILSCKLSVDNSGQSKGFGFVQFETAESANRAIEEMNGNERFSSKEKTENSEKSEKNKGLYVGPFIKRQEREAPPQTGFTNVYVKNLRETTTEEELKEVFGAYGNINSAVVMRDGDKTSKGFGFVNFINPEDAAAAVEALNNHSDGDKTWYVGRAQKKSEREAELRAKQHEQKDKFEGVNLYLKNLEDAVDDEKLKEIFQGFGTVISCKVMRDPQGHSKGSGFVAFETADEANHAKNKMNGEMVGNKPIFVSFAQKKDERRRYNAEQAQYSGFRIPMVGPNMSMFQHGPQVFYNQHAPGFPHQSAGFAYQQQMVPGMRPHYYGPGITMVARQPQPQPRPAGRRPQQPIMPQQQPRNRNNLRYTPTVRNTSEVSPPPMEIPGASPHIPLTMSTLAAATPDQARSILGEHLFPLVERVEHVAENAGKVTGMLLEMDQTEILHLIESPNALESKVKEALDVLNNVKMMGA